MRYVTTYLQNDRVSRCEGGANFPRHHSLTHHKVEFQWNIKSRTRGKFQGTIWPYGVKCYRPSCPKKGCECPYHHAIRLMSSIRQFVFISLMTSWFSKVFQNVKSVAYLNSFPLNLVRPASIVANHNDGGSNIHGFSLIPDFSCAGSVDTLVDINLEMLTDIERFKSRKFVDISL